MRTVSGIVLVPHSLNKDYKHLAIETCQHNPHITVVSLDRTRKLNAIDACMWLEIGDLFSKIGTLGDGCRCILLRGNRAFCSGIDFRDPKFSVLNDSSNNDGMDVARSGLAFLPQLKQMQACFTAIETCPVPVVACMHGVCIGAGIDMVCCADIRLSTANTVYSVREVKLGLAADVGTLQRLPKIVGHSSRVNELCLTGQDFDGNEACRIGFVSRVYGTEHELMHSAIFGVCAEIARNSPLAATVTKQSLLYSRDHSVTEGLDQIAVQNILALQSDDTMKTILAQVEARRKQQQQGDGKGKRKDGKKQTDVTVEYDEIPRLSKL